MKRVFNISSLLKSMIPFLYNYHDGRWNDVPYYPDTHEYDTTFWAENMPSKTSGAFRDMEQWIEDNVPDLIYSFWHQYLKKKGIPISKIMEIPNTGGTFYNSMLVYIALANSMEQWVEEAWNETESSWYWDKAYWQFNSIYDGEYIINVLNEITRYKEDTGVNRVLNTIYPGKVNLLYPDAEVEEDEEHRKFIYMDFHMIMLFNGEYEKDGEIIKTWGWRTGRALFAIYLSNILPRVISHSWQPLHTEEGSSIPSVYRLPR